MSGVESWTSGLLAFGCPTETYTSYQYIYRKPPISRTRKGPGKVSDLARCPTYPIFKISCK